jgi:S-DNA-T family DNA segregation ATPase FtsK/SpoIIIE
MTSFLFWSTTKLRDERKHHPALDPVVVFSAAWLGLMVHLALTGHPFEAIGWTVTVGLLGLGIVSRVRHPITTAAIATVVLVVLFLAAPPMVRLAIAGTVLLNGCLLFWPDWIGRQWIDSMAIAHEWDKVCSTQKFNARITSRPVRTESGWSFGIEFEGASLEALFSQRDMFAAGMKARDIRIQREDVKHAGAATVHLVLTDPLVESVGEWPWLNEPMRKGRAWGPIPVARGENGGVHTVSLPYNNILIAGVPGAGKSVCMQEIVAGVAGDPSARLYLIDPKLVELKPWRASAEEFAHKPEETLKLLHKLIDEMEARYAFLDGLEGSRRKIDPGDGKPLIVVVVDELAALTAGGLGNDIDAAFREIVLRGRAAAISLVLATQKPDGEVLTTQLRDNIDQRWALRMKTDAASKMVIGDYDPEAHKLPRIPGIGYLSHEQGDFRRVRSFYLSDKDITRLAKQAA